MTIDAFLPNMSMKRPLSFLALLTASLSLLPANNATAQNGSQFRGVHYCEPITLPDPRVDTKRTDLSNLLLNVDGSGYVFSGVFADERDDFEIPLTSELQLPDSLAAYATGPMRVSPDGQFVMVFRSGPAACYYEGLIQIPSQACQRIFGASTCNTRSWNRRNVNDGQLEQSYGQGQ